MRVFLDALFLVSPVQKLCPAEESLLSRPFQKILQRLLLFGHVGPDLSLAMFSRLSERLGQLNQVFCFTDDHFTSEKVAQWII